MINFGVGIAILSEVKVLLTRREDFEVWCLPGGLVETGKSLGQTARREAKEETGLEVQIERLVGLYSKPNFINGGSHEAVFAGHAVGGELRCDPPEVIELGWFGPQEIPADLLPSSLRQIRDVFGGAGGSAVWREEIYWPFPQVVRRADLYRLRDESGLTRKEFFRRHFMAEPRVEILETEEPEQA